MKVLVAMSGGVDSSVAAALLAADGHAVTGVTMKLWGGESDTGCCSVSDVDDARRVADHLGIEHHVFNFGDDFDRWVVEPYVASHQAGRTPNPCIECNRHIKFDRLLDRSRALGFDAVATGHHARVVHLADGSPRLARGADRAKDQSYVLHMLDENQLGELLFPIGHLTKDHVRRLAGEYGLRTASKPDSQDVCFITSTQGRGRFLDERMTLTPGTVVDSDGREVGSVPGVQLVTIGQRRGLDVGGNPDPRYVVDVDVSAAQVMLGTVDDLLTDVTPLADVAWVGSPVTHSVQVQVSAHGPTAAATVRDQSVRWATPHARVAPGQSVVFYAHSLETSEPVVVGGATVERG